ncbi:cytochrome P450 [Acaryochloris marina NIES-2412]|uniref:cytochrome P450 n=1 Tax=Acaryochloris marina TaxID=155978 RepID=UPI0040583479
MTTKDITEIQPKLPPGDLGLPFIGNTFQLLSNKNFIDDQYREHGNVFKTSMFGARTIMVIGGEAIQYVLSNENSNFQAHPIGNIRILFGENSLSVQTGEVHQNRRRIIKKAFSNRRISTYQDALQCITDSYLSKWSQQGEFKWYPEIKKYTLDVACKFLIGLDNGHDTEIGKAFESWSEGFFSLSPPWPFTKTKRAFKSRDKLLRDLNQIIEYREARSISCDDVLSYLMGYRFEDDSRLSREEIIDQILVLLFAGHETITSAISSLCLNLSLNPNVLRACQEEQTRCFSESEHNKYDFDSMTFLDQVIWESLRLVPPVAAGFRKVTKTCTFNGHIFPKDWLVWYHITYTQSNPKIYKDPKCFTPDDFTVSRFQSLSKSSDYIPFGGGMRECIGKDFAMLEMKLFASRLISNFTWELLPDQDLEYNYLPVPRPKDDLLVKFINS